MVNNLVTPAVFGATAKSAAVMARPPCPASSPLQGIAAMSCIPVGVLSDQGNDTSKIPLEVVRPAPEVATLASIHTGFGSEGERVIGSPLLSPIRASPQTGVSVLAHRSPPPASGGGNGGGLAEPSASQSQGSIVADALPWPCCEGGTATNAARTGGQSGPCDVVVDDGRTNAPLWGGSFQAWPMAAPTSEDDACSSLRLVEAERARDEVSISELRTQLLAGNAALEVAHEEARHFHCELLGRNLRIASVESVNERSRELQEEVSSQNSRIAMLEKSVRDLRDEVTIIQQEALAKDCRMASVGDEFHAKSKHVATLEEEQQEFRNLAQVWNREVMSATQDKETYIAYADRLEAELSDEILDCSAARSEASASLSDYMQAQRVEVELHDESAREQKQLEKYLARAAKNLATEEAELEVARVDSLRGEAERDLCYSQELRLLGRRAEDAQARKEEEALLRSSAAQLRSLRGSEEKCRSEARYWRSEAFRVLQGNWRECRSSELFLQRQTELLDAFSATTRKTEDSLRLKLFEHECTQWEIQCNANEAQEEQGESKGSQRSRSRSPHCRGRKCDGYSSGGARVGAGDEPPTPTGSAEFGLPPTPTEPDLTTPLFPRQINDDGMITPELLVPPYPEAAAVLSATRFERRSSWELLARRAGEKLAQALSCDAPAPEVPMGSAGP